MSGNPQLQQAIERIAKMDHAGVSQDEIAKACNIDIATIAELQETKKYKEAFRISENLNHYSESDFQAAERKYLKYALTGRI